MGFKEPYREPVFAAADLGVIRGVSRNADTDELERYSWIQDVLIKGVRGNDRYRFGAIADQLQYEVNGLTHGIKRSEPRLQITVAPFLRLMQPMMKQRQIEIAGSAGNTAALADGVEKFAVAQFLAQGTFLVMQDPSEFV